MSCIVVSDVSFSWPDDTPVFERLSFSVGRGRMGLVAPNGRGKSTLLRLIAGELTPSHGSVSVSGTLGYLPQTLPLAGDLTVAQVLGITEVLDALDALSAGDAGDGVLAAIGDDWDIEERTRAQLSGLGLADIAFDRPLRTVSGGEIVSLGLAAQLLRRPDVLLLDEPTNNLDVDARRALYDVLAEFRGCLLMVSHDRSLLDRSDRIAELDDGEIHFYGGNFTDYERAVQAERELAENELRNAKQDLKRQKRDRQLARERAARRTGTAKRNIADAGMPKILIGRRKRSAQESAGRSDDVHESRVNQAQTRLDDADRAARLDDVLTLDLPDTEVPTGRMVFESADLVIRGPERIALTGRNGAGKSTLLRSIAATGERVAHLSQRLDLLDPDRSVWENFAAFAPALDATRRRHVLSRFLFTGAMIDQRVATLSGGERLRATLACVLFAEPAPHLLLLDEPTNNLDLTSVAQLCSALLAYRGAFVVVSHDERFLAEIGIVRWLRMQDGTLRQG